MNKNVDSKKVRREIIAPILISQVYDSIKLPFVIIDDKDQTITLENFDQNEKSIFSNLYDPLTFHSYLESNFKIKIISNLPTPRQVQDKIKLLDFIAKLVLGNGLPMYSVFNVLDDDFQMIFTGVDNNISKTKIVNIEEVHLKQINLLFGKLQENICLESFEKKIQLLKMLLEISMSLLPNFFARGAFYVSILESLFVPDKEQEIAYRLKVRLAKFIGEELSYCKKINNLYSKRSTFFHSGEIMFNEEDVVFLEELSRKVIKEYILNPDNFISEALDKSVIGFR